jgi:ubiquinone/menaquinone biosynthesis C-methylase UbiE
MAEDFCKSRFDAIDICNLLPTATCSFHTNTNLIKKTAIVDGTRSHIFGEEEQEQQERNNFRFTVHNVLKGPIPFESNTFDYVEQSITSLAYKSEDWPKVLQELKRVTKPGGYIQLIEPELCLRQLGPFGEQWQEHGKYIYTYIYIIYLSINQIIYQSSSPST